MSILRLSLLLLAVALARPAFAQSVPAALSHVPPDAAIFVHANVARFWAGAAGGQVRAAKIAEFDRVVAEFEAVTGLTPADIASAAVYFPDLRTPRRGPAEPFGLTFTLSKPIQVGRLVAVAAVGCRASNDKVSYTFVENVLTVRFAKGTSGREQPVVEEIVLDATDALHPKLFVDLPAKLRAAVTTKPGPLTPALTAAATKDLVVGMNFDMMAPEIRSDELNGRAVARPFVPLLKSDTSLFVGALTADALTLELRFRSGDPAVTRTSEKSLGALQTLLSTVLDGGIQAFGKSKEPAEKLLAPLAESVKRSVETATIRIDGTDAVATLAVRADLPFGPALAAQFRRSVGGSRSDRTLSQNNMKQLGLAMHNYESAYGTFPAPAVIGKKGKPLLSWRVTVLPYLEHDNLFRQFKLDEAWDSEHNLKVLKDTPMPAVFALPGVTKPGDKETHYRVFVGPGAAFEPLKALKFPADFPDGLSNTILMATAATGVPWTKPDELAFHPKGDMKKLLMMDGDGSNLLFADGSVRFLRKALNGENLLLLITRADGNVVNID